MKKILLTLSVKDHKDPYEFPYMVTWMYNTDKNPLEVFIEIQVEFMRDQIDLALINYFIID